MMRRILRGRVDGEDLCHLPGMVDVEYLPSQWTDFVQGGQVISSSDISWSDDVNEDGNVLNPWYMSSTCEDWTDYYKQYDEECGSEYHLVFIVFDLNLDKFNKEGFLCFRAKHLPDLDPLFKLGLEEITGNYIRPPVVVEPSGWEYASYKSEAAQIRKRIAGLTERLIEVGEKMRRMERGE